MHYPDPINQSKAASFPPDVGKLAVVTYSTGGLGYDIALALAQAGADVIVSGRNATDGHEALARIRSLAPHSLVRFEKLDLESLGSVSDFVSRIARVGRPVDLLVNNACTLALLKRQITNDGFELHLGTNFLSHFALTARMLPLLRRSRQPRVIQVTSTGRHHGQIHLDDLHLEKSYTPLKAYSQSKLAMLIFAIELQRKSDADGWGLVSSAAQPIGTRAALIANAPAVTGSSGWYKRAVGLSAAGSREEVLQQVEVSGANVKVAAPPAAKKLTELIGPPAADALDMRALDRVMGQTLWTIATQLTGSDWPVP